MKTTRGRPIARLVPCPPSPAARDLTGSVLKEVGDPFGTGERWVAGSPLDAVTRAARSRSFHRRGARR